MPSTVKKTSPKCALCHSPQAGYGHGDLIVCVNAAKTFDFCEERLSIGKRLSLRKMLSLRRNTYNSLTKEIRLVQNKR